MQFPEILTAGAQTEIECLEDGPLCLVVEGVLGHAAVIDIFLAQPPSGPHQTLEGIPSQIQLTFIQQLLQVMVKGQKKGCIRLNEQGVGENFTA